MTDFDPKEAEEALKEANVELPEAPVSITVQGYFKGFSVLITKRNATGKVELDEIVTAVENMIKKGFLPSWNQETSKQALAMGRIDNDIKIYGTGLSGEAETASVVSAPLCPVHKTAMTKKTGKYGEFWSCGTKNPDGTWCKARPELQKDPDWINNPVVNETPEVEGLICEDCGKPIQHHGNYGPSVIASFSQKAFFKKLCWDCQAPLKLNKSNSKV